MIIHVITKSGRSILRKFNDPAFSNFSQTSNPVVADVTESFLSLLDEVQFFFAVKNGRVPY